MFGCWTTSMFGTSSTNTPIILESSYSIILVSFLKYLHQKQNILKSKGYFFGSHWSACQIKRSLRYYIFNADVNCSTVPKNHEKWTSTLKNCGNIHNSKNSMRLKGTELYLRNSLTILCCFYSA